MFTFSRQLPPLMREELPPLVEHAQVTIDPTGTRPGCIRRRAAFQQDPRLGKDSASCHCFSILCLRSALTPPKIVDFDA